MHTYARVWRGCGVLLEALGVGCGFIVLGPIRVSVQLLVGATLGAFGAWLWSTNRSEHVSVSAVMAWAVWGAGSLVTLTVGLIIHPIVGVAGLVIGFLSAPPLIQRLMSRRLPQVLSVGAIASPPKRLLHRPEPFVATMDNAVLCKLWRDSGLWLASASTCSLRTDVVRLRQAIIDELEERHPRQVAEWLDAERRSPSDLDRFIT